MTAFNISIISDTVCPWCYVGARRLWTAISTHMTAHPADSFNITWSPYQLNPDAPAGKSTDKTAYYESKFGPQQAQAIFARLRAAGDDAGIAFRFGGRTGNTLDSHRVLAMARAAQPGGAREGLQNRVVHELFADYFERERDITDHGVLVKAAGRAGMDEAAVKAMLAGHEFVGEVEEEATRARMGGVHGVPHFTINDMYEVEGGQEPAAFLRLFNRLKDRESKA